MKDHVRKNLEEHLKHHRETVSKLKGDAKAYYERRIKELEAQLSK